MGEMAGVATFFRGHPSRLGAALVILLGAIVVAWYLGSPVFVRTYAQEALPTARPGPAGAPSDSSRISVTPTGLDPGPARVLAVGELKYVDPVHNGKGPVQIIDVGGRLFVRFEEVVLTNAPDVHVYLSRETGGKWDEVTSLYLGALKATNGSFNYEIPAGSDVASYQSVVVWCRAFSVLITWADLRGT
jgi:electron transfer DM13